MIPGDGVGLEVVREGRRVLECIAAIHGGVEFAMEEFDWGCGYYLRNGRMLPEDGLQRLADCDAILLGAVGFPDVPDHISAQHLLFPIRQGFEQYVNMRPVKLLKGLNSPLKNDKIDFVVIRENSEGEYCGKGRFVNSGTADESAIQEAHFSRRGTERIIRYAFEYAQSKGRGSLISATKSNALNYSMVFWDKIFNEVRGDYAGISSRQMHVDALAGLFITNPERLELVVASNLFGDILTDLGSAMLGSIGISPSANINPEKKYPSMFEPIHGSAPDIAGKGIANPIGTLWSLSMMCDHLGLPEMGALLMRAIEKTLSVDKVKTRDIGGASSTSEVTSAVIANMRENA